MILRVLVVEDDSDARELLRIFLCAWGFEVCVSDCVEDALERLQTFAPDVLLSDIGMPKQDGYMLIRTVRALPSDQKWVPAIALTAFATSEDQRLAMDAGFDRYLVKPFDPAFLANTVRELVVTSSARRSTAQPA